MKYSKYIIITLIIITFAVAFIVYPMMPEQMVSHWDSAGRANDYISKIWGVFLVPVMSLVITGIFLAVPIVDPLKNNVKKFRKYFDMFIVAFLSFMLYLYLLTIFWNLNYRFEIIQWLVPAFTGLLYFMGVLMEHTEPNWFVGIRTPWTITNPTVWDKTHKLGSKIFKIASVITMIGIFVPTIAVWFILIPLVGGSFWLYFYSYLEFKKETANINKN